MAHTPPFKALMCLFPAWILGKARFLSVKSPLPINTLKTEKTRVIIDELTY